MSISFKAKVRVAVEYLDGKIVEHTSEVIRTELCLGSFRALRSIMVSPEDYSGMTTLTLAEAADWLNEATAWFETAYENGVAPLQIRAARAYINMFINDEFESDTETSRTIAEVIVSWG